MYPFAGSDELINIVDLYDENNLPAGTRVEVRIPFDTE
jgi:hypothetical protein